MSIQLLRAHLALVVVGIACLCAQDQPPALPPPNQALSPGQLDDLVAPASSIPIRCSARSCGQHLSAGSGAGSPVAAAKHRPERPALKEAVQQQNWDPSIQTLGRLEAAKRRYHPDHQPGQRVPGAAAGGDGRGTTYAATLPKRPASWHPRRSKTWSPRPMATSR